MIKRWIYSVVKWFSAPVVSYFIVEFEELRKEQNRRFGGIEAHICDLNEQIRAIPDHTASLEGVDVSLAAVHDEIRVHQNTSNKLLAILEETAHKTPALSIGTLMAWEAVAYSADKYAKDKDIHGIVARDGEVIEWANAYLEDRKWPKPPVDVLQTLLTMRDMMFEYRREDAKSIR